MRKWSAIAAHLALFLSACAPTTEVGSGIVSTSLCGDGYALASGAEVAALSWQSDGPLGTEWTGRKASANLERLVAMQPETLLLGPGESVRNDLLPDTHIISLNWVEDWEGVKSNLTRVSGLGPGPEHDGSHHAEGLRLSDTPGRARILYLSRAGGTAGPGTFVDAAIRRAGGVNIVNRPGWFTPDPEWIVAQDPDVVLVSFLDAYESVNSPVARNAVIADFIASHPRIDVPGRLWPCAGPGLAEAAKIIREGLP